jgi:hypothetical protein
LFPLVPAGALWIGGWTAFPYALAMVAGGVRAVRAADADERADPGAPDA